MPWTYVQTTGNLISPTGGVMATGYSGAGEGKNSPEMQNVKDVGPIPEGFYEALPPINSPTHGPYAIHLVPDGSNEMFGRDSFLMHGDSADHPGQASQGCIVVPRFARERFWESGNHRLQVVKILSSISFA